MKFKTRLVSSNGLIDLTPLVDVIFLLLIFFIMTSDILPLKSLNVENPSLNKNSAPLTTQLLVIMDADNVIYLGPKKELVDLPNLQQHLTTQVQLLKKQHPGINPTIVLSVDKRVEYGPFLRLFSMAQDSGERVRLVYQSSNNAPQVSYETLAMRP